MAVSLDCFAVILAAFSVASLALMCSFALKLLLQRTSVYHGHIILDLLPTRYRFAASTGLLSPLQYLHQSLCSTDRELYTLLLGINGEPNRVLELLHKVVGVGAFHRFPLSGTTTPVGGGK